jgi:hypothetical protein
MWSKSWPHNSVLAGGRWFCGALKRQDDSLTLPESVSHIRRILLDDLIFDLGWLRQDQMGGGADSYIFLNERQILDQYATVWRERPPATGGHLLELGIKAVATGHDHSAASIGALRSVLWSHV